VYKRNNHILVKLIISQNIHKNIKHTITNSLDSIIWIYALTQT